MDRKPPNAARLSALLDRGDKGAAVARVRWHRSVLWTWKNGKRVPLPGSALELQEVFGRRALPLEGWYVS